MGETWTRSAKRKKRAAGRPTRRELTVPESLVILQPSATSRDHRLSIRFAPPQPVHTPKASQAFATVLAARAARTPRIRAPLCLGTRDAVHRRRRLGAPCFPRRATDRRHGAAPRPRSGRKLLAAPVQRRRRASPPPTLSAYRRCCRGDPESCGVWCLQRARRLRRKEQWAA